MEKFSDDAMELARLFDALDAADRREVLRMARWKFELAGAMRLSPLVTGANRRRRTIAPAADVLKTPIHRPKTPIHRP
jgi:hypothetical protein